MSQTEANDEENFRRYMKNRVANVQKEKLSPPPPNLPIDQLILALCAEGMMLLEAEEKAKNTSPIRPKADDSKKLDRALAAGSKNPYARARAQIFSKMTDAQHKEIEEMERTGNTKNHIYANFVAEVSKLGDKLSENKNNKNN